MSEELTTVINEVLKGKEKLPDLPEFPQMDPKLPELLDEVQGKLERRMRSKRIKPKRIMCKWSSQGMPCLLKEADTIEINFEYEEV